MALSTQRLKTESSNTKMNGFMITPTNMTEAMSYAQMVADSAFCPKDMKGKCGDVLIAMQMGAEVGLSPIQALQNIAVINGRPSIWGDAALAVVIGSPHYISHREWFEGSIEKGNLTAFCAVTRRNSEEHVRSFSMEEAKKAGLWSKAGVWQNYPARMLQMRARAFAMRDKFADALRGINFREEVEDYDVSTVKKNKAVKIERVEIDVTPSKNETINVHAEIINPPDYDMDEILLNLSQTNTKEELQKSYIEAYKVIVKAQNKADLERLMKAKD